MTRRERNSRAKHPSPSLEIARDWEYCVNYLWELRSFCEGSDKPVTPGAINDWQSCLGLLLSKWEKATLLAMDRMLRVTLAEETAYNEKRRQLSEAQKAKR